MTFQPFKGVLLVLLLLLIPFTSVTAASAPASGRLDEAFVNSSAYESLVSARAEKFKTAPVTYSKPVNHPGSSNAAPGYTPVMNTQTANPRPHSFIGALELQTAKKRVLNDAWAKNYLKRLESESNSFLKLEQTIPRKPAGYASWYVCKDGTPLVYKNGQNYCPSDKQIYEGEKIEAGRLAYEHNERVRQIRIFSTAFALNGNETYAEAAQHLLLQYADMYKDFAKQDKGGRWYYQSLDEAVSAVDLASSYDLLYSSRSFTEEEKEKVEQELLFPIAETLKQNPYSKSNWQAWHNAAIGMIGAAADNQDLLDEAINGKRGFYFLMDEAVLEDGFWWEGSMAYHTYALAPLSILAQTASHWGYDLYSVEKFKKMFDIPLLYSYPNFVQPANNDGGKYGSTITNYTSSRGYNDYELAYSKYKDRGYAWFLHTKYKNLSRTGDFALFFGSDSIEEAAEVPTKSLQLTSIGQAILRHPDSRDQQSYVLMDYGDHGGSHGHYDKLNIDVYGAGMLLAPDFGTPGYTHPLYRGWYKQSISHNTVTIDGKSQSETKGEMPIFSSSPDFKYMYATADGAYEGVTYERSIWMEDEFMLDWFLVKDDAKTHQYDLALHGLGEFETDLSLQPLGNPIGKGGGYEHLKNPKGSGSIDSAWRSSWNQNGKGLRTFSIPFEKSSVLTAGGPGPSTSPSQLSPIMIQRVTGNEAQFVTILQPYTQLNAPAVTGKRVGQYGVRAESPSGTYHFYQNHQEKTAGKLTAAKASSRNKEDYHFEDNLSTSIAANGELKVTLKEADRLQKMTLVFNKGTITSVSVNGKAWKTAVQGGYIMAFQN
ncbi:alginate lyase family protein [Metabacillus sp. KIGAM252]|uniref:Alginate lyase family protein n=1 Tax=Metabacillus flavus TaxID=2823519 RepID=A0ABS5LHV2_9BACI|nr:heparinase II/III family protein [Metabacillus flavus]MBS2970148.1 alginate lyase family protein [Metabacillus flavus]